MTAKFSGGKNIAMKVPPRQYDQTVAFCRHTLEAETPWNLRKSEVHQATRLGSSSVRTTFGSIRSQR